MYELMNLSCLFFGSQRSVRYSSIELCRENTAYCYITKREIRHLRPDTFHSVLFGMEKQNEYFGSKHAS